MSTHSELPAEDWRNKPMHWDFSQKPRSPYEAFVLRNLSGPEDPALKLSKGQFIVYMRHLGRESRGDEMLFKRSVILTALLASVTATNKYWPENDVITNTFTDLQYQSIFHNPLLITGVKNANPTQWQNAQQFRHRLDEFFSADHDESTLAKLPAELQQVYHKYKDQYNDAYASQDPLFTLNTNLTPQTITQTRAALKAEHNLTDAELNAVITSCDAVPLLQQVYGVDDVEGLEQRAGKDVLATLQFFANITAFSKDFEAKVSTDLNVADSL
jgi:hypothetical protein